MGRCSLYTGIRLLLLIHPFISSFFYFSTYQTLKIFITFFAGTVRSRILELDTHVDSGQMYCVYRNQAAALICPFISSFFFFSNYQTLKNFHHIFLRNCEVKKIATWYTHGLWADVLCIQESGCCCLFVPLFLHFSFSPIFKH